MHVQLQPAWILHSRPYRETSLLVEAFSLDHGRVGLVARGAKRPKSRLRGELQPFRALLLSWSGRGELATLIGADSDGQSNPVRGSALAAAFYLNELLLKLLPRNDPHPHLYVDYVRAFSTLDSGTLTTTLRIFEKRLLSALGWGLMLEHDADGNPLALDQMYAYDLERGPLPAAGGRLSLSGASLTALAMEKFENDRQLRDAQRLTRAALAFHMGSDVIRSRELLVNVKARNLSS